MENKKPIFICLDGADGCGKTTLTQLAKTSVESTGRPCEIMAVLGHGPLGKEIRKHLFNRKEQTTPALKALLIASMILETYDEHIRPALNQGLSVILDRDISSFYTYQWHTQHNRAAQAIFQEIFSNSEFMPVRPDLLFHCQIEVAVANDRMRDRLDNNYFDEKLDAFKRDVQRGFEIGIRKMKMLFPKTFVVDLNCNHELEVVQSALHAEIIDFLKKRDGYATT